MSGGDAREEAFFQAFGRLGEQWTREGRSEEFQQRTRSILGLLEGTAMEENDKPKTEGEKKEDKPKTEGKKKEGNPKGVKKTEKSSPAAAAKAAALAWVKKRESEKKA